MGINERFNVEELLDSVVPGIYTSGKVFCPDVDNEIALNRSSGSYGYGLNINADDCFNVTGAAKKSFVFQISGERIAAYPVTGDSNDALIKISGNNYAANDANFIFRGLNASINNRSGGTLGMLNHSFGAQNKSGGTCPTIVGLSITAENYGTVATEFGGLDINLKNEGAVATTEYGIRIRNTENSIGDAVGAAILITDTGANTGFDYLIDANGASATVVADIRLSNGLTINNDKADRIMIGAVIGFCNDTAPADNAPANGVVLYYDGTDLKAINNAGTTATLNSSAFA